MNASLIPELYKILCKKAAGGREFRIQIFIITVIYLNDNIIGHDIKQRLYFFSDFFKLIMGSIVRGEYYLSEKFGPLREFAEKTSSRGILPNYLNV